MHQDLWRSKAQELAANLSEGTPHSPAISRWISEIRAKRDKMELSAESIEVIDLACRERGVEFDWTRQKPGPKPDRERDQAIFALREQGQSLRAIGEQFDISRQRVFQILNDRA